MERRKPRICGAFSCAEEDSNLHPVSLDQALNLVTRVSHPSYASRTSYLSADLDGMDALDDLDVATDVATAGVAASDALSLPGDSESASEVRTGYARFMSTDSESAITVSRPRGLTDRLRSYRILIDGEEAVRIRSDTSVTIPVAS